MPVLGVLRDQLHGSRHGVGHAIKAFIQIHIYPVVLAGWFRTREFHWKESERIGFPLH